MDRLITPKSAGICPDIGHIEFCDNTLIQLRTSKGPENARKAPAQNPDCHTDRLDSKCQEFPICTIISLFLSLSGEGKRNMNNMSVCLLPLKISGHTIGHNN